MGFCRNTHCVICDFTLVPKLWCHIFTLIVQPHISPHGSRVGGAPSCRLTELWNWPLHAALCFTDSVSAAIFFLLLEFVFTARMRLWLSIHNALTSIKLWHFSQITWAAISCFNTVTPQSMWVKDTIRDLSIKSIPTWDVFVGWRRDWTWTSGLSGRIVCFISFWNMKLKYLVFLKGIWMLHAGESDMFTVFIGCEENVSYFPHILL